MGDNSVEMVQAVCGKIILGWFTNPPSFYAKHTKLNG